MAELKRTLGVWSAAAVSIGAIIRVSGQGVPVLAVVFVGLTAVAIVLSSRGNLDVLAQIFNFGTRTTYFFINLSLIKLRWDRPGDRRGFSRSVLSPYPAARYPFLRPAPGFPQPLCDALWPGLARHWCFRLRGPAESPVGTGILQPLFNRVMTPSPTHKNDILS